MKRLLYFLLDLVIIFSLISCELRGIEHKKDFRESQQKWQDFKKSSGNNYTYVTTNSSWTGVKSETTITVINGVVKERAFKYSAFGTLDEEFIKENGAWIEHENDLNTHPNSSAAQPLTLDEIYDLAKNEWLKERDNAHTYFEAANDGLISMCGYVDKNCADDCFIGIHIASIKSSK